MRQTREEFIIELKEKYSYKNFNVGRNNITIEITDWNGIVDFILADRKRVVEPLVKWSNLSELSKHQLANAESAINQTLRNAGIED